MVVATILGISSVPASAVVGNGSSGRISSPLDTAIFDVDGDTGVPTELEAAPGSDATSEGYCGRQGGASRACNFLKTADATRVLVANVKWEHYHTFSKEQSQTIIDEIRKTANLSELNAQTKAGGIPESALQNFRSVKVLKERNTELTDRIAATALTPTMRDIPGPPMVVASYASADGSLHIEAVRSVRRLGGEIEIQQADVTPYHFDMFKVMQAYTTKEEQQAGRMGRNPFDFAKSDNPDDDKIFRNLSISGAKVAMGLAMRLTGASFGLMTGTKDTWRQWTEKKGKWWKKTITYHTGADTESIYYAFTPATTVYAADDGVICADDPGNSNCAPALKVTSGVTSSQWTGGTFPEVKQVLTYHHQYSVKKSFNFLKVIVIAALMVVGVGYVLAPLALAAAGTAAGTAISTAVATAAQAVGTALGISGQAAIALGSALTSVATGNIVGAAVGLAGYGAGLSAGLTAGLSMGAQYAYDETKDFQAAQAQIPGGGSNEHVQALSQTQRSHIRKSIRTVAAQSGIEGMAVGNISPATLGSGSSSMNDVMIPSGALHMYAQRARIKADQHAERVVDIKGDLELSTK